MTTREQLAQRARGTPFEILYRKGTASAHIGR